MDNRITIRHTRKREFFSKLALDGKTAQVVLGKAIDNYLEEKAMNYKVECFDEGQWVDVEDWGQDLSDGFDGVESFDTLVEQLKEDGDTARYRLVEIQDDGFEFVMKESE